MEEKIYHLGIKALIQNKAGEILLLKVNQEKFKNPTPGSYWDIPGGRVLNDSTIEETLSREIEEETGIKRFDSFKHLATLISNIEIPLTHEKKAGLILSIYGCVLSDPINIQLSSEHTDYAWFSPTEASGMLSYKYPKEFTEKVNKLNFSS